MTADGFARALRARIAGEVRADMGHRALYAGDASNHRVLPRYVVFPRSTEDVIATVDACREEGIPLTSRGGGTSIAGNAIGPGVVLDFSRHLHRILAVDAEERTATVQPGVVMSQLQRRAAPDGLRFGPDPSSHNRCTIAGMVGNNACGSHSVAWGTTVDSLRAVDLVLPDGSATSLGQEADDRRLDAELRRIGAEYAGDLRGRLGRFPRDNSGYLLQHLLPESFSPARAFVGSEGTCGVVTEIEVDLVPLPAAHALTVAGFPGEVAAAGAAPLLAALDVLTVEGIDQQLVATFDAMPGAARRPELPAGQAWLMVEVAGGDAAEAAARAAKVARQATDGGAVDTRVLTSPAEQRAMWTIRERGAGLGTRSPDGGEAWPGWEDAAVPPENLADYLRGFRDLMNAYGRHGVVYGHFGHGCVHVRIDHDLLTERGRAAYGSFQRDAADLVVAHGGSLSGEHGDGRARSGLLSRMYGDRVLSAFGEFKRAFDPGNLFNPGILVDPVPVTSDLRLALSRPRTDGLGFAYPDDDGDFSKAVRRCVGVGACRKESGGGMCPSYRATRDEQHSTRGRARLLFEMLDGALADEQWQSDDVAEALDLCLSCKACASECPVSVDMATYKAEFLHQRYRRRLRPRAHLSMGWLPLWLAFGRRVPRLANALATRRTAKRLAGIDQRRQVPRLARRRSASRPGRREQPPGTGEPVSLWVDSFTRSFSPQVVTDAIAVLQAAGYAVQPVGTRDCCALTWVSTGQLGVARRILRRTVRHLAAAGDQPIVVLEPSCAAALRHDAPALLDTTASHRVAARVTTLAQALGDRDLDAFLDTRAAAGSALAQFHCHQRAVLGTGPDLDLLTRMGVEVTTVDEGCCGLAGNFGMEDGHYDVSVTCAEQSFLPHLDELDASTPVLADGFSCRVQIEQLGHTRAVHLAQLLRSHLR